MLLGVGRARGPPLPFPFYPAWQQWVTKNDREAKSRNRAKYGQSGLDSPERFLRPKKARHQGEQPHPLPRSGSVQQAFSCEYIANLLVQRQHPPQEPGALHLTRQQDLLELELPAPDLSLYDTKNCKNHPDSSTQP